MDFESKKENIEKTGKEARWQQTKEEVENIRDRRRKGIDEKIKSAVVALKANGFGTTGSCEGHLDWGLPWPYVDVESPLAEELLSDLHYNALREKAKAALKEKTAMSEAERREYNELVLRQIQENEKEHQRLAKLLQEYYESGSQEISEETVRLTIKKGPWNQSCLQPENMPNRMSPEEIQKLWSKEDKEKRLALYRKEMDRFVEFLKNKFFIG